jgi:rRNA maturation protein Nop10
MTAKEEDILTSTNLIKKGVVLDKLLKSLIISPIDYNTLLVGDKNALMIASRILGYGKNYNIETTCSSCGEKTEDVIDLTLLKHKECDFEKYTKGINEFQFELPSSKRSVTFKLLESGDERKIDAEIKALKKFNKDVDSEITSRLKYVVVGVDGETDKQAIRNFVDTEFLSRDSLAFRTYLAKFTPDVDMDYYFTCDSCGYETVMPIPMTVEFFWPAGRK